MKDTLIGVMADVPWGFIAPIGLLFESHSTRATFLLIGGTMTIVQIVCTVIKFKKMKKDCY